MLHSPANPPLSRWQISLRALLVAMLFVAVIFGWVADRYRYRQVTDAEVRRIEKALDANYKDRIEDLEREVELHKRATFADYDSSSRYARQLHRRGARLGTVPLGVSLKNGCSDADLALLAKLPSVKMVWLNDGGFTAQGLAQLRELPALESLWLTGPWVNGDTLAPVGQLESLKFLALWQSGGVTDGGLKSLSSLRNLETLDLIGTKIGDDGLAALQSITSLKDLRLRNTKVTDAGLAHLRPLSNLNDLYLANTRVTDAGLVHLQALPLHVLELDETALTDDGLRHLAAIPTLRRVSVRKSKVTQAGAEQFRKDCPDCKLTDDSIRPTGGPPNTYQYRREKNTTEK